MISKDTSQFAWADKYRPKTVAETILPNDIKSIFLGFVEKGDFPNLLLTGPKGMGKTSVAKALVSDVGGEYFYVNGSLERNIDVIRDKVHQFVSTVSMTEANRKYVIIDEADGLNVLTQPALKAFIEEYSHNAGFILTANHLNKIIPELHSRGGGIEFRIPNAEKPKIAMEFLRRLSQILDGENVPYEKSVLVALITKHFPDWRRVLNECQMYASKGAIDNGILANVSDAMIDTLIDLMKKKDFTGVRKWVTENGDQGGSAIFRAVYDRASSSLSSQSVPEVVITLAKYGFQSVFSVDQEVNTSAALAEVMLIAQWK